MYFHFPEVFQELQILPIFMKQMFQNTIEFLIKIIQIKCEEGENSVNVAFLLVAWKLYDEKNYF